jgi:hypothetical protein
MSFNYEDIYEFHEPHQTGGDATIRITVRQIIDYQKPCHPYEKDGYSDQDILDDFIVVHWAYLIKSVDKSE